jgi:hypothetical protein
MTLTDPLPQNPEGLPIPTELRGPVPLDWLDAQGQVSTTAPQPDQPSLLGADPTGTRIGLLPLTELLKAWILGEAAGASGSHSFADGHITFGVNDVGGDVELYRLDLGRVPSGRLSFALSLPLSCTYSGVGNRDIFINLEVDGKLALSVPLKKTPGSSGTGGATITGTISASFGLPFGLDHHIVRVLLHNPGGVAKDVYSHGATLAITDLGPATGAGPGETGYARDLLTRYVPIMSLGAVLCASDGSALMDEVPNP